MLFTTIIKTPSEEKSFGRILSHPSITMTQTCIVNAKADWRFFGSLWWPDTLQRHVMLLFPLICYLPAFLHLQYDVTLCKYLHTHVNDLCLHVWNLNWVSLHKKDIEEYCSIFLNTMKDSMKIQLTLHIFILIVNLIEIFLSSLTLDFKKWLYSHWLLY